MEELNVPVSLGTQAPVAIRVAAGQTSATFQINTVAVTSSTTLTITATLNGIQRTATLTVLPVALEWCVPRLFDYNNGDPDARREDDFNDHHLERAGDTPQAPRGGHHCQYQLWNYTLLLLFNPAISGNTVTFTGTNGQGIYTNMAGVEQVPLLQELYHLRRLRRVSAQVLVGRCNSQRLRGASMQASPGKLPPVFTFSNKVGTQLSGLNRLNPC